MRNLLTLFGVLSLSVLAACTVKHTEVPPLAGPSEMALGVTLQAVPDSILQDGTSQSTIMVEVHGPTNTPVRALPLRAEIRVDGVVQDFGSLSAKTVVTGDDGRARIVYTAPPASLLSQKTSLVTIAVVPVGSDYRGETFREVDIKLVPQGVIGPSNPGLVADFTVAPSPATSFSAVLFDGSLSTNGGVRCGAACSYSWNFGDGSNGSGLTTSHEFRTVGTFLVSLTVTDARGATAVNTKSLIVNPGTPPTASFEFSPTTPLVDQDIFFTAESSRAVAPRKIVAYDWNFGSGRTGTGVTVAKGYSTAGSYQVTLNVTDDAGGQGTVSKTVDVGKPDSNPPTVVLTYSPKSPIGVGTTLFFDGSSSTPGASPIASYTWSWGDGSADSDGAKVSHAFSALGTYVVRLTVTDTAGRSGTATVEIKVPTS
jgi:PKD repeat protein